MVRSFPKPLQQPQLVPMLFWWRNILAQPAGEDFPTYKTFRRLGDKAQLAERVVQYCRAQSGFGDVIGTCEPLADKAESHPIGKETEQAPPEEFGSVYLIKAGPYYKIGRSNAIGRREREIALQLPDKPEILHVISTDDPVGIEAYWHKRFAEKRKNGEWFQLSQADVKAFRRRKFM